MEKLLTLIKVKPNNQELYKIALSHSSYSNENNLESNERLEFLGDSILQLLMSEHLYNNDNQDEGNMTKKRAHLVRKEALVHYAKKIELANYILLGKGEVPKGPNSSIIADAFEAFMGALYLDQGYETVKSFFKSYIKPEETVLITKNIDYKSQLQEDLQTEKRAVKYEIISETGQAHNKTFKAAVLVDGIIFGIGVGKKKQSAEQMAAKNALSKKAGLK